ncbi:MULTISPECIES: RICIN domain-containing protein [Streptosporangium]|uniref:RICIN domain-containing protein n=1 Tax=Streptosporangium jomthongense TaxID=1193683 RepID=A0ABV8F057_9ACTN
MGSRFARARRVVGLLTKATLAAMLASSAVPSSPAHADGTYRWQSNSTGTYLEVLGSSLDNGARVIVWPYDAASQNQLWSDFKLWNPYYLIVNNNSSKVLGHADRPYNDDFGLACGFPDQYNRVDTYYQMWDYRSIWSPVYNRYFSAWINRAGCQGNPYHDVLVVARYDQTTLYTEDTCTPTGYSGYMSEHINCYWKRNGQ